MGAGILHTHKVLPLSVVWGAKRHAEKSVTNLASLEPETFSTKVWHFTPRPNWIMTGQSESASPAQSSHWQGKG
jgi:hypothetical protein